MFIEQEVGRPLLWLACLHHVMELLLHAAVVEKLGPTSGPSEKYFTRFQTYYNALSDEEKEKIKGEALQQAINLLAPEDDITAEFKEASTSFFSAFATADHSYDRGDYKECSLLIRVFLTK